jgi:uncharacterized protein (TIGR00369 family)
LSRSGDHAANLALAIAAQPYARLLGVLAADGETATARLPFRDDLVGNPLLPAIHGGALGAFMEIAAVAELVAAKPAGRKPRTVDISIDYLRPAKPAEVFARASVRKIGRRVAYVQVEAWQDDAAQPVAALRGHFLLGAEDVGNISPA